MEIRGLAQGLAVFHVEMVVHYRTSDGYDATHSFPTMYVVGGNEADAIKNAIRIVRPNDVRGMYAWSASAFNADPYSEFYVYTENFPATNPVMGD